MAALLLLTGCRTTEELTTEPQTQDLRFGVFLSKDDGKPVNYSDGFAWLMKRYDSIHQLNFTPLNPTKGIAPYKLRATRINPQEDEEFIDFNIRSYVAENKTGDKLVIFPRIRNKETVGLVISAVNKDMTKVIYGEIRSDTELFQNNIDNFKIFTAKKYITLRNKGLQIQTRGMDNGLRAGADYIEIEEVVITVPRMDGDWSWQDIGGNTGGSGDQGCKTFSDCGPNGGSGGGNGSTHDEIGETEIEEVIIQHIDDSELKKNKCADEVYQKLKNTPGLFTDLLSLFEGDESIMDLEFELGTFENSDIVAQTVSSNPWVSKGTVTTTLNMDRMGSTELGLAAVFLHEMVHAKIAWILRLEHPSMSIEAHYDALAAGQTTNSEVVDLLMIYNQEFEKRGVQEKDHEFIGRIYVNPIKEALEKVFGTGYTETEYKAAAWMGLQKPDAFKDTFKSDGDTKVTLENVMGELIKREPCTN